MKILAKILINTISLLVVAYILPGFVVRDIQTALITGIIIGVVNTFIRPVIQLIFLPLSILTLGIFAFIINVALLWFVSQIVPGFEITSFLIAAVASILLALVSSFLGHIVKE